MCLRKRSKTYCTFFFRWRSWHGEWQGSAGGVSNAALHLWGSTRHREVQLKPKRGLGEINGGALIAALAKV